MYFRTPHRNYKLIRFLVYLPSNQITNSVTTVAAGDDKQLKTVNNNHPAAVEQMSANIQQIAKNTTMLATESSQTATSATEGSKTISLGG